MEDEGEYEEGKGGKDGAEDGGVEYAETRKLSCSKHCREKARMTVVIRLVELSIRRVEVIKKMG